MKDGQSIARFHEFGKDHADEVGWRIASIGEMSDVLDTTLDGYVFSSDLLEDLRKYVNTSVERDLETLQISSSHAYFRDLAQIDLGEVEELCPECFELFDSLDGQVGLSNLFNTIAPTAGYDREAFKNQLLVHASHQITSIDWAANLAREEARENNQQSPRHDDLNYAIYESVEPEKAGVLYPSWPLRHLPSDRYTIGEYPDHPDDSVGESRIVVEAKWVDELTTEKSGWPVYPNIYVLEEDSHDLLDVFVGEQTDAKTTRGDLVVGEELDQLAAMAETLRTTDKRVRKVEWVLDEGGELRTLQVDRREEGRGAPIGGIPSGLIYDGCPGNDRRWHRPPGRAGIGCGPAQYVPAAVEEATVHGDAVTVSEYEISYDESALKQVEQGDVVVTETYTAALDPALQRASALILTEDQRNKAVSDSEQYRGSATIHIFGTKVIPITDIPGSDLDLPVISLEDPFNSIDYTVNEDLNGTEFIVDAASGVVKPGILVGSSDDASGEVISNG